MKLSEIIENIIVSGVYNIDDEFMCNILDRDGLTEAKLKVQDMVQSISPASMRGAPLACALHKVGIIDIENMSYDETFTYTKQLYCWWVFDLKRKGL